MPLKFGSMEVPRKKDSRDKLPDEDKIFKRLSEAGGDLLELRQRLYPLLMMGVGSGQTKTEDGIVKTLAAALDEYAAMEPPPSVKYVPMRIKEFIRALTPGAKNNPEIKMLRETAWGLWQERQE